MKIIKWVLALAVMLSLPTTVKREEKQGIYMDENGYEYYVDEKGLTHQYYDTNGNRLSVEETLIFLEEALEPIPVQTGLGVGDEINGAVIQGLEVDLISNYKTNGPRVKCTADLVGPGTITFSQSVTTTMGWSGTASASIKGIVLQYLTVNLGLTVNLSSTTSNTASYSFPVPSGKTGAIYFTPKEYYRSVYVYSQLDNAHYTVINLSPSKLINGFTEGVFELITW